MTEETIKKKVLKMPFANYMIIVKKINEFWDKNKKRNVHESDIAEFIKPTVDSIISHRIDLTEQLTRADERKNTVKEIFSSDKFKGDPKVGKGVIWIDIDDWTILKKEFLK